MTIRKNSANSQEFSKLPHEVGVASMFPDLTVGELFGAMTNYPFVHPPAEFLQIQLRVFLQRWGLLSFGFNLPVVQTWGVFTFWLQKNGERGPSGP